MNIKEIVLKAGYSTVPAYWLSDEKPIACSTSNFERLVSFAEALISAYKAELLKEVGEPVAYYDPDLDCGSAGISFDPLSDGIGLYTPDQVAAAILKVTKPLEGKIERLIERLKRLIGLCKGGEDNDELRAKLAAAQEEIERLKRNLKLEQQLSDSLKMAARMLGTGNYVDWIKTIRNSHDQIAKAEQRVAEYNELIYAVQTKNPDETRHQTALRYIRNAENRPSNAVANGASS